MAKKTTKAELEQGIKTLREETESLNAERRRLLEENMGLRETIEKWRQFQSSGQEKYHQLEVKASQLEQQNAQLKTENEYLAQKVDDLRKELFSVRESLGKELTKAETETCRAEQDRDDTRYICRGIIRGLNDLASAWDLADL